MGQSVIYLFPSLFRIFLREQWPLDELLAVQQQRVAALLQDIKSGKITLSGGHYHFVEELMDEMRQHVAILQQLAMCSQAHITS